MTSDLALFRRRLLKNPRQVSAIAPSSRTLARAMTLGLGPHSGAVVEFGLVGATMHGIDERVPVEDLRRLTAAYERLIELYFASASS